MSQLSSNITTASAQWASRPNDERFISLTEMSDHFHNVQAASRALVVPTTRMQVVPNDDLRNLELRGANGFGYEPTHWSFGQLASLANAPAGYLRTLPSPMAADCLNYGLRSRSIEDVGLLLSKYENKPTVKAATGPRYGRIWNSDVVDALISHIGDGINGSWRVPGEFGVRVEVDRRNTTLYASDRDMWVFLADEERRIEVAGRSLARGFFTWNSEVGSATFGLATFLFDFVCKNRIIWGATKYSELKIRHTVSAPDKFLQSVQPALLSYANSDTASITDAVEAARKDRLSDVSEFLANRFGPKLVKEIQTIHQVEEQRPIETRWDVVVASTAYARGIEHQDSRVEFERSAGSLLNN